MYLYEPIGADKEGNEISLLDIIEAPEVDVVEGMELKENVMRLYQYVEKILTDREKEIIVMRYGLQAGREVTQRELAERLGISRSYSAVIIGIKLVIHHTDSSSV